MKINNHDCETIQLNISNKLDECIALDLSEKEHLECCSDCQQFYNFVHGDVLQQIAVNPADEAFEIEKVSQVATVMEKLMVGEPESKKNSNIFRVSIVGAAVAGMAALAAVSISDSVQPSFDEGDTLGAIQEVAFNKKKMALPTLKIPEINLDEKYSAINTVVVSKIESVSNSIGKLKACFVEGNAFLDEHTQSISEGGPESLYFNINKQVNIS